MSKKVKKQTTSWEKVSSWYGGIVKGKGHYYHKRVILPNLKEILAFDPKEPLNVLDLGCGEGVFSRILPKTFSYTGVDFSPSLVKMAKEQSKNPKAKFFCKDATKPLNLEEESYDLALFLLSLQDMEKGDLAIQNAAKCLRPGGLLVLVLNHPCFRIPKHTHWGVDLDQKIQYRRVERYLSPLKIPIATEPSKQEQSKTVTSFHRPLKEYFKYLNQAGLAVTYLDEWVSDKTSTGGRAKMENLARKEFPLFLALFAEKL